MFDSHYKKNTFHFICAALSMTQNSVLLRSGLLYYPVISKNFVFLVNSFGQGEGG